MAMTHDPLCPSYGLCDCGCEYDAHCMCGFIAKVRADELRRPSEDGWMSVRAVLEWDERIRADEREESIRRVTALWNRTREDEGDTPLLSDVKKVIRGDKT